MGAGVGVLGMGVGGERGDRPPTRCLGKPPSKMDVGSLIIRCTFYDKDPDSGSQQASLLEHSRDLHARGKLNMQNRTWPAACERLVRHQEELSSKLGVEHWDGHLGKNSGSPSF